MKLDENYALQEELQCLHLEIMDQDSFLFVIIILIYYFTIMYFDFIRLNFKLNQIQDYYDFIFELKILMLVQLHLIHYSLISIIKYFIIVGKNYYLVKEFKAFSFVELEAYKCFKMLHNVIFLQCFLWLIVKNSINLEYNCHCFNFEKSYFSVILAINFDYLGLRIIIDYVSLNYLILIIKATFENILQIQKFMFFVQDSILINYLNYLFDYLLSQSIYHLLYVQLIQDCFHQVMGLILDLPHFKLVINFILMKNDRFSITNQLDQKRLQ